MITEADTCRKYVVPGLVAAGWDEAPHSISEQKTFTDGRVLTGGGTPRRQKQKRADYLLRYARDFMMAVVEAKAAYRRPGDGLQQAKQYAQILDLRFAYSTNGHGIVEFDFLTGLETVITAFPTPDELWHRLESVGLVPPEQVDRFLEPFYRFPGHGPRYYQEIAVNRTVRAVLNGDRRLLLTMATGTGKTVVAFQIAWKLWKTRWNAAGAHRRPRVLYLADRNVLVDDPRNKTFAPFGEARSRIEPGHISKSREMYFALYQSLAQDERRPGLYREYPRDFFDLIIVDECHRGSARAEGHWREILEYFEPAYQLGMTATPLRDDTRDTYRYFGNPLYQYSLRQGIADGFLAPYQVRRVVTDIDATGWRPTPGERDRLGREIPDGQYSTEDFDRVVALKARTLAIARHLSDAMAKDDRFGKTIVFCVDQEHADDMRQALNNLNADLVAANPDYTVRITSDEGQIGRGHLERFQDVESTTPVIACTSQLLTTGVDVPTCRNVVIARIVNSLAEFKQIIGRGTRIRNDYGKLSFTIIDYTGSATQAFADPDFDGDPAFLTEEEMDAAGEVVREEEVSVAEEEDEALEPPATGQASLADDNEGDSRKFYVDGGVVEIALETVYELGADGRRLRSMPYLDYVRQTVASDYQNAAGLRASWADQAVRRSLIENLSERGIDLEQLAEQAGRSESDPLDLLCYVTFGAPTLTRRERVDLVKNDPGAFLDGFGPRARQVLEALLMKYAEHGLDEFTIPDALKLPDVSHGRNLRELADDFGGAESLRAAVATAQRLMYEA